MKRLALAAAAAVSLAGVSGAMAPTALAAHHSTVIVQKASRLATSRQQVGRVPAHEQIELQVSLRLRDAGAAAALARAVSDPASASYGHYLTARQWEKRFSPTAAAVARVRAFLKANGVHVTTVTPDRMAIFAHAGAATVSRAFATRLGLYRHLGRNLRLASRPLRLPRNLAGVVLAISGIDQSPAIHAAKEPIPYPEGFRNGKPCSNYFGEKLDTTDPLYFSEPSPYAVCGYTPTQLQSAYGLNADYEAGITGSGQTVAIIDAYASPSLYSDARRYSEAHEPAAVLGEGQFHEILPTSYNEIKKCEASGWFGEQTLDVEAVHATAPGANILYVGARNCERGLYKALATVVDNELASVVTNSWGTDAGDLLESSNGRRAYDNLLMMAGTIGIGVQFSSGDQGDNFTTVGFNSPDYPASSPYATAVGGTSLAIGPSGERTGEWGWSTSKSILCTESLAALRALGCTKLKVGRYIPAAPGKYDYGSGGGTSYHYTQPSYQAGIVPAALAERNKAVVQGPMRTVPDVSMAADPATGMLIGETQAFPTGIEYGEYRVGGTSMASPLFAGVMALADQRAGKSLGFVNPLLYTVDGSSTASTAFYDVKPPSEPLALMRVDFLNGLNAEEGELISARGIDFQGSESYCSGTGSCTHEKVQLSTATGYDSMTGIGSPGSGFVTALANAAH